MKLDWLVIRSETISLRIDRRVPPILLCLAVAVVVAMVMNLGRGEYPISPLDIVKTVLGIDTGNPDHVFVWEWRWQFLALSFKASHATH